MEFSFLTLVDSEVFVTHRPSKLNEALALVRPFHWQVGIVPDEVINIPRDVAWELVSVLSCGSDFSRK